MSDENQNSQPHSEEVKFFTPLQDPEHLQLWLEHFLGFTLPDCRVTEYADSTPLEFVWQVYRAMMDGLPLNALAVSGRDSSKTVSLSVIDLLSIAHDERSAVHFGMVKKQATRARTYLDRYIARVPFLQSSIVKENSTEIILMMGGAEVGLELLPCTKKAAQGAHGAMVSWDEIGSSVDPSLIAGYRDSAGVPGASSKGKPAVTVKISSRHASDSLVEAEIKNASATNLKIVKWTTLDCTEKCPDSRSGSVKTPLHINTMKGKKYTPEEFQQVPDQLKDGFKLEEGTYDGCIRCPIVTLCKGKLKNQTSTSKLLRKIDDVITKFHNAGSYDWSLSQLMSLKPSPEGLVYTDFSRDRQMPGWNAMWERLTGKKPEREITRHIFVEKAKKVCTIVAGEDFGWSKPSTCVVMAIDKRDNVYILDAYGKTFRNDPDWVGDIDDRSQGPMNVQMHVPDPENKSAISIMIGKSLPVAEVDKSAGSVRAGINEIKRILRVPGTNDETKLFIAPDLLQPKDQQFPGIVEEFEMYRWPLEPDGTIKDDKNPEKANDHFLDALRYCIYWYFGQAGTFQSTFVGGPESPQDMSVKEQMLRQVQSSGFQVQDNTEEWERSQKDPDDDDDDPDDNSGGPSGGMTWSWS